MSKRFLPQICVNSVFDIDTEKLKQNGIRAFVFDIDNTVATYAMPVPDDRTALWLKELEKSGFKLYFASNNSVKRVETFAKSVGIPYFARACKPLGVFLRRACRNMGVLPRETALVGDQLFTDVWGGNRLGMCTILVKPISETEDKFVKWKRGLEKWVMQRAK